MTASNCSDDSCKKNILLSLGHRTYYVSLYRKHVDPIHFINDHISGTRSCKSGRGENWKTVCT